MPSTKTQARTQDRLTKAKRLAKSATIDGERDAAAAAVKRLQAQVENTPRSLDTIADDIHSIERGSVFAIGKLLLEAKERCSHGEWLLWLEKEFSWCERTALNYMNAALLAAKFANFADLKLTKSTIYLLARYEDAAAEEELPAIIAELAKHAAEKRLSYDQAHYYISIAEGRRIHGDYPDATLYALRYYHHDAVVAALKDEKPETDQAANDIIDRVRAQLAAEQDARSEAPAAEAADETTETFAAPAEPTTIKIAVPKAWAFTGTFTNIVEGLGKLETKPLRQFIGSIPSVRLRALAEFLISIANKQDADADTTPPVEPVPEKAAADLAVEAPDSGPPISWEVTPSKFAGHDIHAVAVGGKTLSIVPVGKFGSFGNYNIRLGADASSAAKIIARSGSLHDAMQIAERQYRLLNQPQAA